MDDNEKLKRLAIEEILQETRRAAVRANEFGSTGWMKCPLPKTNKRFIHNTLLSTLSSIKRQNQTIKRHENPEKPKTNRKDSSEDKEKRGCEQLNENRLKDKRKHNGEIDKKPQDSSKRKNDEDSHRSKRRKPKDR